MFKLHAYFVFHLGQRCMLFYGQLEPRDVDETTFTKLFIEAEKLLIGQSKLTTIDNAQFVLLNHEDIISGALVSDVSKQEEKDAITILTKLGKAFKRQFQAEIDEYDPNACDLGTTFGGFSTTLATMLAEALAPKDAKPAEAHEETMQDRRAERQSDVQQQAGEFRFPGGDIPPEERDEILFHEYEDLCALYNVEMVDGVVSKNKIYIYANIGDYHEITVDYSNFPLLPKISMPSALSDILAISHTVQSWSPQNPPRIVDVITEIEQLVGTTHPSGLTASEKAAEVAGYMNELGFEGSEELYGKELSRVEEKVASNELASRLLAKEKKGNFEGAGALDAFASEPMPTFVDKIINESKQPERKTSLRDMVAKQKAGENDSQPVEEALAQEPVKETEEPKPVSLPTPVQKPQKFVIRPRFVIDGEEIEPGKMEEKPEPAAATLQKEPVPPPDIGPIDGNITIAARPLPAKPTQPEPELIVKPATPARNLDEIDHSIDITARPRPTSQPKTFAIPDVNDLDTFVPTTPVKRPEIMDTTASGPKPVPASQVKPAQKPTTAPAATSKTTPKKKDEEDMFGWGDDGGEMEVKQSKVEIKDFDGPIKKVPDHK